MDREVRAEIVSLLRPGLEVRNEGDPLRVLSADQWASSPESSARRALDALVCN